MPRHKHCEQCGLDFEPKQLWERFCRKECIDDYQKAHPPQIPNPNQINIPIPWPTVNPQPFPTPSYPGTAVQYWTCGICGQNIPMTEQHVHTVTFTSGNP